MLNFVINNTIFLAVKCSLLGDSLTDLLNEIFTWIQYAIPALAVVLCTVDIAQAVISQDDNNIQKAQSKAIKRIIIGVAIFFIPMLLKIILNYGGNIIGTCGIGG